MFRDFSLDFFNFVTEQGQKRPLDTPKRMMEKRERRRERERKVEGEM